jgi:hypothetical protein
MPNNAYFLVEQFLRSSDPQSRRNALTALALMDDDESIGRLCKVALTDEDESVRKRAVEEIVSLPETALPRALGVLHASLKDETNGQRAYAVLGQLKGLGRVSGEKTGLSLYSRVRLAWMMNSYLNPSRSFTYRVRVWKPALGAAAAFILVLVPFYAMQARWPKENYILYPILIFLLSVLTSILTTQRTTPINLYLDRKAGAFVEIVTPLILSSIVWIPIILILTVDGRPGYRYMFLALMLGVSVTAAVTRAATLLSFGVIRNPRKNSGFQLCVAFAVIFLLLAVVNFVVWSNNPNIMKEETYTTYDSEHSEYLTQTGYFQPVEAYGAVEVLWIYLLPLAGALAASLASIDKKSPPVEPVAGRFGVAFSSTTVGLSAALLVAIILVGRHNPAVVNDKGTFATVNINGTFEGLKKVLASSAMSDEKRSLPPRRGEEPKASPSP